MITEKLNIRMDSVFSDDKKHRFLLRRSWSRDGKIATIIMSNPSSAECLITDTTSMSVYNAFARLEGYASINIVNLYSLITPKLNFRWNNDEDLSTEDNDKAIHKAANEADDIILAWGTLAHNNLRVKHRILEVMKLLEKDKDKIHVIQLGERSGMHPLCPQLRTSLWELKKVDYSTYINALKEELKETERK